MSNNNYTKHIVIAKQGTLRTIGSSPRNLLAHTNRFMILRHSFLMLKHHLFMGTTMYMSVMFVTMEHLLEIETPHRESRDEENNTSQV